MKYQLLMTTAAAVFSASMAFAQATLSDQIVAEFQDQGYTRIELRVGPSQIKVEAYRGNSKIEVVYDKVTGAILSQDSDPVDAGDDTTPGVQVSDEAQDFVDDSDVDHDANDDANDDENDDANDDANDKSHEADDGNDDVDHGNSDNDNSSDNDNDNDNDSNNDDDDDSDNDRDDDNDDNDDENDDDD